MLLGYFYEVLYHLRSAINSMKKWGNRTERVRERAAREEAIIEKVIIGLRDREFDKQVWIIEHQDIQYLINVTQRKWKPEPNEIFIVKLMTSVHGVLLPRAWRLHVTVCAETLDMTLKAQKAYCAIYIIHHLKRFILQWLSKGRCVALYESVYTVKKLCVDFTSNICAAFLHYGF